MNVRYRNLAALFLVAMLAGSTAAQVATGTPRFGTFGGGPFDVINLANLNVHFEVPVIGRAGRGLPFSYILQYDSSIWNPANVGGTVTWQPVNNWGWTTKTATVTGTALYTVVTVSQSCSGGPGSHSVFTWNAYVDDNAVRHPFNLVTNFCSMLSASGFATDGSGYHMAVTYGGAAGWLVTVTLPGGKVINNVPVNNAVTAATKKDENGNQITTSNGTTFVDTLGTTVLTVSGNAPIPVTHAYTAPSGANATIIVMYTTFSVKTNFGVPGINEYGPTNAHLVSSIVYPDGSSFRFTYEDTPGFTGKKTGRIASITLPTGGTISYSYIGGWNGILGDGKTAGFNRTVSDLINSSTTAFWLSNPLVTTHVVDLQTNQETVHTFSGMFEKERKIYSLREPPASPQGTLLHSVITCYNGTFPAADAGEPSGITWAPCTNATVTEPITQRVVYPIFPKDTNPHFMWSGVIYNFNSNGLPTQVDEWGLTTTAGSPTTPDRRTTIAYASLGNGIVDRPSSIVVKDGANNIKAQTEFFYDETGVTATSGTPQHVAVTGARGNLTRTRSWVGGTSWLTKTFTYFDTGTPNTATDVNGAVTSFVYGSGSCGSSFVTAINMPLNLSRSLTHNCTGGVPTSATDENGKTTTTNFSEAFFWRPASVTDPLLNTTDLTFTGATVSESSFSFNGGASAAIVRRTLDALGRPRLAQRKQSPSSANFNTVQIDYDALGRPSRSTVPFVATAGQTSASAPATTTTYDAIHRPTLITDAGGGTVSFEYKQNNVMITVGPAPTGENTKRKQYEYDAVGRLISVCEITSAAGSGECAQTNAKTGYWTKYKYDTLGNLIEVKQNAQSASPQTRTFVFDALGRMTSETNPESGTVNFTFDNDAVCNINNPGDLVKREDAGGNRTCFINDTLHRLTDVGYAGPNSTPCKRFRYDTATVNGVAMANAKGRLARASTDNCAVPTPITFTDVGFSYNARGEITDSWQMTPNSSGYSHVVATYHPHGALHTIGGLSMMPTITYGGLDGQGRITTVSDSLSTNLVTAVAYNNSSTSQPLGALTAVNFGNGDSDNFNFDPNTGRMTQYQFNVNSQAQVGALTWNAIGSLEQLNITDAFNSSNVQTCSFGHDDLSRLTSANCGTGAWNQTYSYDAYGNISKTGSGIGTSFQAVYNAATNRISSLPGFTPTYDSNGNLLNDSFHQYQWDAEGRPISIDSVTLTYDALGRMVEQERSGVFTQIVYSPNGAKLALMASGWNILKLFVPLPGGATAVYGGFVGLPPTSVVQYYRHSDWLGSSRLASNVDRTVRFSGAYAPFGEDYAPSGTTDLNFTGQNQDTVIGNYDFMFREYSPVQGRWISPDPLGLAAVNLTDPQTWNRYGYVANSPLDKVDPLGLCGLSGIANAAVANPAITPGALEQCAKMMALGEFRFDLPGHADFVRLALITYLGCFRDTGEFGGDGGVYCHGTGQFADDILIRMPDDWLDQNETNDNFRWWKDFFRGLQDKTIKLGGFAGCVEANRLDNALETLGDAYGHSKVGKVASNLTVTATGVALLNTAGNFLFGAKVPALLGRPAHYSTWLRQLGQKTAGRILSGASVAILIGEGAYNGTAMLRCAVISATE